MATESNKAIYIIGGIVVLLLVAILFMAFRNPDKSNPYTGPLGGPQQVQCKPNDPGFDENGYQNPLCGTPKCDPNKPGYNLEGNADFDCGWGAWRSR